jgi:hypothetical protein
MMGDDVGNGDLTAYREVEDPSRAEKSVEKIRLDILPDTTWYS